MTLNLPLDSRTAVTEESNFGDLVADAILAAAPGADFAFAPADETRPTLIPAGKTDTDQITNTLRADDDPSDTVVIMKLSGAQVLSALAHGLSRAPSPFEGFLQVSGLTVHYDLSKHGDARVTGATITKSGQEIKPSQSYRVAMPSYLANGALGYFDIWAKADPPEDTHLALSDAVVRFALAHQPLACKTEDRISGS